MLNSTLDEAVGACKVKDTHSRWGATEMGMGGGRGVEGRREGKRVAHWTRMGEYKGERAYVYYV